MEIKGLIMTEYIKTIYPHGIPRIYADKNKRNRTWSPYQYVPYYINENELLDVFITGGEVEGTFFAVVGLPSDSENLSTYSLVSGHNRITIKNSGLLSFVNNNDNGNVIIKINSSHQRVPFFNLYENSNLDFHTEMELYHDAKYVILSNKLSDIIVTYSSAKKYIKDVTKLMINYDVIIEAENKATGVFSNGKADYKLDPNRNLHIEVNHGFMFATNEYTGYNDGQGAMSQLLGLSNERWGVWHENGHQRQQFPWEWSGGTGLTEVTTNIYSLFAQEAIYGKARRIDENMPEIKRFLENNNPNKSYDDQDLFLKLGLFWQLKLAFGDQFYPQLHQLYRLMQDTPPQHDNNKQKQLFILTVSNLVNINLSPFFSKWGIDPDLNTLSHISFLPKLKKNIWEYTNDNYHQIEMPEPEYIPELIYLKNSISDVSIEKNKIKFTIDKDWYSPYDYIFERNGVYIGSVYGGQHYYCSSTLVDNGYQIVRTFSDEESLSQSDIFSIRVDYLGNHMIYYSSMEINDLWDKVKSIYTDDNFTELKSEIIQDDLDELWELYDSVNNDSTIDIRNKILFAQQLLISKLVDRDYFDHSNYTVYFNNLSFENYQFKAISGNDLIAELNNGTPVNSTINGLTWNIPLNCNSNSRIDILVNFHSYNFIVKVGFSESTLLESKIDELYSQKENEILKESVSQTDIDSIRNSILNSNLPFWKKTLLLDDLDIAQRIYLANTIQNVFISGNNFYVNFVDNNLFRDYRYMLYSDKHYISEVSYGQNYYSSLNHTTWVSRVENYNPESLNITAYVNDKWYLIYESSSETKNIVYDYPENML